MSQRHPVWVAENHVNPCNSVWHGVKVSSGMWLSMLHKISIQRHKVSSNPLPLSSLYLCIHKKPVLEISRHTNVLTTELTMGLLHRVPYPMFFFEYSLCRV